MKVVLADASVFECGDTDVYRSLRHLFEEAAVGRHVLAIDDAELISESDFFNRTAAEVDSVEWQELLSRTMSTPFETEEAQKLPRAVVGPRGTAAIRSLAPICSFMLPAEHVGEWARQPLMVILENQADEILLDLGLLASQTRIEGTSLADALRHGWLRTEGRGGTGELQKRIERSKPNERLFALYDSDREEWEGPPASKAGAIHQACCEHSVPDHCLLGREVENYVPECLWSEAVHGQKKPRSSSGRHRARRPTQPLLYEELTRRLVKERAWWAKQYGNEVLETVLDHFCEKSSRPVPQPTLQTRYEERLRLGEEQRMVDDLKRRLGEKLTEAVLKKTAERFASCEVQQEWLTPLQIRDLTYLAEALEIWL